MIEPETIEPPQEEQAPDPTQPPKLSAKDFAHQEHLSLIYLQHLLSQ